MKIEPMQDGILYIVATPIGNLDDISTRAVDILRHVDLILAEDTRHSGQLLQKFAIVRPVLSYHQHNEAVRCEKIIAKLIKGISIALISDAGTPLISDPGLRLVQQAHQAGIKVSPIPGACAAIAALSASGLDSSHFYFIGFLPQKSKARCQKLTEISSITATLVFYESPHRLLACLEDMINIFGGNRYAIICREITKLYETIHGDCLSQLLEWVKQDNNQQRGEFVIIVAGKDKAVTTQDKLHQHVLNVLLDEFPVKQAVNLATKITGSRKSILYQQALKLKK